MSFYIKPKFKIGQIIFSIKKDQILQIQIESIVVHDNSISYLSGNNSFLESQSFSSSAEIEDFLQNSIRLPFVKNDTCWRGDLTGVHSHKVNGVTCFFQKDLKKPYNMTTHADNIINSSSCFENQIEATKESLRQVEQYYKIKE